MMDFLNFTFQSFWHFVGVLMLLTVAVSPIHTLMAVMGARK